MIRIIDFILALVGLILTLPVLVLLCLLGFWKYKYPLFVQSRIGLDCKTFTLVKFRTMDVGTKDLPTHLVSGVNLSRYGKFLRNSKLDELPQMWNVLLGDMSFVGPRPCLPTQLSVIDARLEKDLYKFRPGITGFAQIEGIDMSMPIELARSDSKTMKNLSLKSYFKIICSTILGKGFGDPYQH